jgi:hypothetical protein
LLLARREYDDLINQNRINKTRAAPSRGGLNDLGCSDAALGSGGVGNHQSIDGEWRWNECSEPHQQLRQYTRRISGKRPDRDGENTVVSLALQDTLQRALKYNFGIVAATENAQAESAERIAALSELLPSINVGAQETLQQTSLSALGLRPATFPGHLPVPSVIGPYNYFDLHGSVTLRRPQ